MKNIKNRSLMLGLALLGATTLIGFNSPASARPGDRQDDRRDVKQAKREVQQEKRDLKDARRDLREERREARQPNRRPIVVRPAVRRPVIVRPVTRPVYGRPGSNRNNQITYTGTVFKDTSGNDFDMRINNGRVIRVYARNGEPGALSNGDLIRVRGYNSNGSFQATDVDILRNR